MKARVLTALVGIPIVLGLLFHAHWLPLAVFLAVVAGIGLREMAKLVPPFHVGSWLILLLLLVVPWPGVPLGWTFMAQPVATMAGCAILYRAAAAGQSHVTTGLASGWILGPLAACLTLHRCSFGQPAWGVFGWLSLPLLALVPLWAGDSAAIFAGRAFGKHPLAPSISPKKTWEGAVANFLACVGAGAALGWAFWRDPWPGLAVGVVAGIMGQLGDLFESWLKRKADVKDSGALLPGHGGVLDRLDSLFFTAPWVGPILMAFGRIPPAW